MKHKPALIASCTALLLAAGASAADIKVNQAGFLPASQKLAVVSGSRIFPVSPNRAPTASR
jgi:Skp family chaperone for outer membrane proteins